MAFIILFGATIVIAAPRLHTCGNKICDPDGNVVVLRGVAIADAKFTAMNTDAVGGHYSGELADTPENQLRAALRLATDASKGWHANIIRVPVHVDDMGWGFGGWNTDPEGWTSFLDAAIEECVLQDVYCLIDYHSTNNWNYPLSNIDATKNFWSWAGEKYKDIPNVMFELFNEPVTDLDTHVWPGGSSGGSESWSDFKNDLAQPLVDYIRNDVGAIETFLVIGGPMYSGFPIRVDGNAIDDPAPEERIAYALHVYGWHWFSDPTLEHHVGAVKDNHPIIVTEFGYETGAPCPIEACSGTPFIDQDAYGVFMKNYIQANDLSFTAWVFDNSFRPVMFEDAQLTTIAGGSGYMGQYTKDFLAEEKDNDRPCNPCGFSGKPTAFAGEDQFVFDTDGNAGETVQFTGIGSDIDGTIVSYVWKEDNTTLSTSQNPSISLSQGVHSISLTVTDNEGFSHTDYARIEIASYSSDACTNLLQNGDFSAGESNWNNWVDASGANASFDATSGELDATIITAGDSWQIQYWNTSPVSSGTQYIVKYRARASSSRTIELMVEQAASPYQNVTSKPQSITTSMQDYSHSFTSGYSLSDAKIGFKLGGNGTSDVVFDDVVFAVASTCSDVDTEAPSVPTNVTANGTGMTTIALSWTASTDNKNVMGYKIFVNGVLKKSTANITATSVSGLDASTTYAITLQAIDGSSNASALSSEVFVATDNDTEAPTTPTAVTAITTGATTVDLTWSSSFDNVGVTAYDIFVDGILDHTVGSINSTTVSSLSPSTSYAFTIKAIDAIGNASEISLSAIATTDVLPDTEAPTSPTAVTATPTGMFSIELQWAPSTDNIGVTSYHVFMNGGYNRSVTTAAPVSINGLAHNTSYTFYVQAFDAVHNSSAPSALATAITLADSEAPTVPTSVVALATSATSVDVTWVSSSDNLGVTGYEVYVDGSLNQTVGTTTSATINTLAPETEYSITLKAIDAATNKSSLSTPVSVTTEALPDTEIPSIPLSVIATATGMYSVDLNWSASTDNVGVVAYEIFMNGNYYNSVSTSATVSITNLTRNTSYSFYVLAKDAASNRSPASAITSVTTLSDTEAPTIPAGVIAIATGTTSFDVSWNASTDNVAVTGYNLYVDGTLYSLGSVTNTSITGLDENTTYTVTLEAFDAAGNISAVTTSVDVTTDEKPDQTELLIEAEDYSSKHSSIQSENTADVGGGQNIGWISAGRWVEFANKTLAPGTWEVEVRVATWASNSSFDILVDGVNKKTFTKGGSTYTGSNSKYQTWASRTTSTFTIDGGDIHTVRLNFTTGSQNLNWIRFVPVIPDTEAPSTVTGLVSTGVTASATTLDWNSASDNIGVVSYDIYQDGSFLKNVSASNTTVSGLSAETAYAFTVKAKDAASNTSVSFSNTVTITTEAVPAVNILTNGDFSNGSNGWDCNVWGGAATCAVLSGEYFTNITNAGSSDWNIQPTQDGFQLQNGVTYTFAFDARATTNRVAKVKVETDGSPWSDYAGVGSGVALTTSMDRFSYTFTMSETANARVVLNIAANGTNGVYLDNVWIVEGSSDPCGGIVGCP